MKEHIYTIPVMDGFNEGGECPFCNMYHKLDTDSIEYMLGASYMEDDIRLETDMQGFCKYHYKQLYNSQNRLGLALMVHTHLQKIYRDIEKSSSHISFKDKPALFSKSKETPSKPMTDIILTTVESCYICTRVERFFVQYVDTFFHLWKQNNDLINLVKQGNGFCLQHFSMLINTAESKLKRNEMKEFCDIIIPVQIANIKRLEEELDWFIKKFDYRFQNEPWKNSQDALPRSIQKVASIKEGENC